MMLQLVKLNKDRRFGGVVVITSASHAEGPEFNPRSNLFYLLTLITFEQFEYASSDPPSSIRHDQTNPTLSKT